MPSRFYYRTDTGQWLNHIDHDVEADTQECLEACSVSYGIPVAQIGCVEFEDMIPSDHRALLLAADWEGMPPERPSPSATITGGLFRKPRRGPDDPPPDPADRPAWQLKRQVQRAQERVAELQAQGWAKLNPTEQAELMDIVVRLVVPPETWRAP
ncbi:MAG: hypothetical protein ACE5Q6_16865 [Dehalococcoidia bacterium]